MGYKEACAGRSLVPVAVSFLFMPLLNPCIQLSFSILQVPPLLTVHLSR